MRVITKSAFFKSTQLWLFQKYADRVLYLIHKELYQVLSLVQFFYESVFTCKIIWKYSTFELCKFFTQHRISRNNSQPTTLKHGYSSTPAKNKIVSTSVKNFICNYKKNIRGCSQTKYIDKILPIIDPLPLVEICTEYC